MAGKWGAERGCFYAFGAEEFCAGKASHVGDAVPIEACLVIMVVLDPL